MDERKRQMTEELTILNALVQATARRDEVFEVIEDSEDLDEAISRVGQLLNVGELPSRAVLDVQARRFTRDQRKRMVSRVNELRSMLADGH